MAWFGVNAMTQPNQVAVMYERGFRVATVSYVESVGPWEAMSRVLDYLLDGTDALYVRAVPAGHAGGARRGRGLPCG